MAQPNREIKVAVSIDARAARIAIKRVLRAAEEANRELARLEARLEDAERRLLSLYGIRLEVEK